MCCKSQLALVRLWTTHVQTIQCAMHDMILDVRTKHYSIDDNSRDNIYKMTFTAKKEE